MDVRSVSVTGPLGDVPPSDQLMTVTRDDRDSRPVLVVRGEVDLSTGGRLRDTVSSVLQQTGAGPVILDLSAVEFLSSSGLGHLVALDEEGRRLSRPLRIVVNETRPVDPADHHDGPRRRVVAVQHRRRGHRRLTVRTGRRQPGSAPSRRSAW